MKQDHLADQRMKVIDDVTQLMLESRLFEDPEMVRHHKHPNRKKKQNTTAMGLKIGQGGTLDPLADGVLGTCLISPEAPTEPSHWRAQRHQALAAISHGHQGEFVVAFTAGLYLTPGIRDYRHSRRINNHNGL